MHSLSRAALAASIIVALNLPTRLTAAATFASIAAQVPQASEVTNDSTFLLLRSGIFDPTTQQLDFSATGAAANADSHYVLIQFQKSRLDARKRWAQHGVDFVGYVPNNAYFARLHGATLAALRADPAVRWAGPLQAGMKLDPTLWTGNHAALEANVDGRYEVVVLGFRDESAQRLASALNKVAPSAVIDVVTARADAPRVRVRVDAAGLPELIRAATALEGVSWVAPYWPPRLANDAAVGPMQGNADSCTTPPSGSGQMPFPCESTPLWDHGIIGTNQIIGIADTGLDHNEAWFSTHDDGSGPHVELTDADNPPPVPPATGTVHPQNKVYAYWVQPGATAYDNNGTCPYQISGSFHGTHTSGTLAGDSSGVFGGSTYVVATPTNPNHDHGDGMVPNAQILFQDIGNDTVGCLFITDIRATIEQAFAGGARIHSDSWGFGENDYTDYGADIDHELWSLQDMLIAFAAGNSGPGSNSIWSPANAKNVLAVGALGHGNSTTVANFSSRGPTPDGRVKPDIMAPGVNTVSALGNNDNSETIQAPLTQALSGTSMATPTIAGNSALMRQYFTDGYYPRGAASGADALNPSGMLMKAVLLNGTNPLQTSWPNNNIGWGRMWLDQNLYFNSPGDAVRMRYWERTNAAGLATGEEHDYTLENVGNTQEFRVSLVWYDPEGALAAATELVNDLDLEVVAPDSTVYKGNVLSNGVSVSGGNADILNPVEMVRFTTPLAGAYTLRVKGTAVPGTGAEGTDRQGYALVASGAFGIPDQPAFPAPSSLDVASNDTNGVAIGFVAQSGSEGFQLYRTDGTCASADSADYRMVASGDASPLVDDRTQGGYSYAYAVRGVSNDIEGDISTCQDVVSNDTCTLLPTFDQTTISTDGSNATCSVQLAWSAAISNCPVAPSVSYTIERDTDPYFPAPVTLASNVSATNYDDAQVANGQPYYYRVIAVDGDGNQSVQPRTLNVTPSGAGGPDPSTFLDDVDTHTYMTMQAPWQITNTAASAGTFSYHSAGDDVTYPSNSCARMVTPTLTLPASATILSYVAQYNLEFQWDGTVVEISTDGGSTWNDLPPDAGYPSDFSQTSTPPINGCGYAATHGAFNGKSTATSLVAPNDDPNPLAFHTFTSSLAVYAGQSVQIRWSLSTDYATEFEGFFLDQVQINDGVTDRIFKDGFDAPDGSAACR